MKTLYDYTWAKSVLREIEKKYTRATNFLWVGLGETPREITNLLQNNRPEWAKFRDTVRILDKRLYSVYDKVDTTQMFSEIVGYCVARAAFGSAFTASELLTAFGFSRILGEQSFQVVVSPPKRLSAVETDLEEKGRQGGDITFSGKEVRQLEFF